MTLPLRNFAIAGYRSFGKEPQYFDRLSKINLLIGRNNAGKSNVIRFLMEIYPKHASSERLRIDPLDAHQPDRTPLLVGSGEELIQNGESQPELRSDHPLLAGVKDHHHLRSFVASALSKLFVEKKRLDGTELAWSLISLPEGEFDAANWLKAIKTLQDNEVRNLWSFLCNMQGGDRIHAWEPDILKRVRPHFPNLNLAFIPAVRQVGAKGSESGGFDGAGIIEKLARLQNPDVHEQQERKKFQDITTFLQTVIDNSTATIEIPHSRETILVHMDGKTLPLNSLGSGIHEVLILASAATTLSDHLVCIEEPEIHLNPVLQRKLVRYLSAVTTNQYIISTHSAALMDAPGAEIYHIQLQDGCSSVQRVSSSNQRSAVCEDLGYHPSDLLQANCVIWVEGPSDRIYLNYWLAELRPDFVEGIQYSIMFYGGRLAAHLSGDDLTNSIEDFISLRRLNRRGVMLLDSDRPTKHARINQTKRRLEQEFNQGPGHAWITEGREIENYLPANHLKAAILATSPNSVQMSTFGKFERTLELKAKSGKAIQASKVEVARFIASNFAPDFSVLDLHPRLKNLVSFIEDSNPSPHQ